MEEEKNESKDVDLMDKFNNPNYDEKGLFCICVKEAERTMLAQMNVMLSYNRHSNLYFPIQTSDFFLEKNFQKVRIEIYKAYDINLTEEEFDENNVNNIAKSILMRFNKLLEEKQKFQDKLATFISFGYFLDIGAQINHISGLLKDFFQISKDGKGKYHCFPKYNIELIETIEKLTEKEPSLRQVLDFMYAGDYKNALRVLVDDILDKHKDEYKNKIQQGNETLFDIGKLSNFVNNYKIRHSKNRKVNKQKKPQIEPTDEQLKVHLDFGLSIYRLFCIYQDENDKKSA